MPKSIDVGKDADIVIWEHHPLRLGARPKQVIIDGIELDFQASWTKTVTEQSTAEEDKHYLPPISQKTMHLEDHGLDNPVSFEDACNQEVSSFVLRNVSEIFMNSTYSLTAQEEGLYVIVKDGEITCLGAECDRDHIDWPSSSPVFEMGGATLIPVMIDTLNSLFTCILKRSHFIGYCFGWYPFGII